MTVTHKNIFEERYNELKTYLKNPKQQNPELKLLHTDLKALLEGLKKAHYRYFKKLEIVVERLAGE